MKKRNDIQLENFLYINLCTIERVPIIVVYKNPLDYPNKYVARLWGIKNNATNMVVIKDSLEEIRKAIPKGMQRLKATSKDDPVIVETYI
ncbi:MAG: hypothetical protein AB7V48_04365 [Sedimentibacter sp.]